MLFKVINVDKFMKLVRLQQAGRVVRMMSEDILKER